MFDKFWQTRPRSSSKRRPSKRRRFNLEPLEQRSLLALTAAMVADIHPGAGSSSPSDLTTEPAFMGNSLYFAANDGVHGNQLWHSDGTAAGTSMVKDIGRRGASSDPEELTVVAQTVLPNFGQLTVLAAPFVKQTLFFTADDGLHGREFWKSDGTASGTVMVKDILPGVGVGSNPQDLTAVGSTLYFTADDGLGGSALWKSDGTGQGTTMVRDFPTLQDATSSHIDNITDVKGTVFFNVLNDYPADPQYGIPATETSELWKSKGTLATTTDFGFAAFDLTESGDRLYFDGFPSGSSSYALFATNPALTSASAIDANHGSYDNLTDVNGTLYYSWADSDYYGIPTDIALARTNGTAAGTKTFYDLGGNFSDPGNFTNVNGTLYFTLFDESLYKSSLYKTNGTSAGTVDAAPTIDGFGPEQLTLADGLFTHLLYFTADDGVHGRELWELNTVGVGRAGSAAAPSMVRDIAPGSDTSSPANLTASKGLLSDGTLFFTADDGAHGVELWRTANLPAVQVTNPGDQANNEGDLVSLPIVASGGPLIYGATGLPAGLSIDPGTGVISGTIGEQAGQPAPYNVKVTVSNGGFTASAAFNWTVSDITPPAVASPGPQSSNEGNTVGLFVSASDADGDPLVYGASGLPAGLSIDSSSGLISGTLGNQSAGVYQVTVSASDGSSSGQTTFAWTVGDLTVPAIANPGPQASNEGNKLQLAISASDADSDPLTFSAGGLPAGLTIDPNTGIISGTLGNQSAGTYQVTVSASDGTNAAQVNFTWTVNDLTPPTVVNPGDQSSQEGQTIQLQIQASDADSDPLTYSAANLPTGLSIDPATGLISGTVAGSSAGSYDVQVNVSDGTNNSFIKFTWVISRPMGV